MLGFPREIHNALKDLVRVYGVERREAQETGVSEGNDGFHRLPISDFRQP